MEKPSPRRDHFLKHDTAPARQLKENLLIESPYFLPLHVPPDFSILPLKISLLNL